MIHKDIRPGPYATVVASKRRYTERLIKTGGSIKRARSEGETGGTSIRGSTSQTPREQHGMTTACACNMHLPAHVHCVHAVSGARLPHVPPLGARRRVRCDRARHGRGVSAVVRVVPRRPAATPPPGHGRPRAAAAALPTRVARPPAERPAPAAPATPAATRVARPPAERPAP